MGRTLFETRGLKLFCQVTVWGCCNFRFDGRFRGPKCNAVPLRTNVHSWKRIAGVFNLTIIDTLFFRIQIFDSRFNAHQAWCEHCPWGGDWERITNIQRNVVVDRIVFFRVTPCVFVDAWRSEVHRRVYPTKFNSLLIYRQLRSIHGIASHKWNFQ